MKGFEALERLTALKGKVDLITHQINQDLTEGVQELINGYRLGEEVAENDRINLATSLKTATGENYDGKTWEELNELIITVVEDKNEMLSEVERIIDESEVIEYDNSFVEA